ncbi:btb poz domain-containing protein [Cyclospora cayetanensis]|uniref:Btb poz domain-containing protein n=1 Tax=Cyclospora cayetanensis TaxID=88456 RepID=A0A1D3D2R8_9EIME|nr:btb poz domain-containing protein [Cyclospora cayetanensis]
MSGRSQNISFNSFDEFDPESVRKLTDFTMSSWVRKLGEAEVFETDMQHLILNYLTINGLVGPAEEFIREARIDPQMPLHCIDCRAKIREAILAGRTEDAIRQISCIDPMLLNADAEVTFLLHKQQLLRLIEAGDPELAIDFAQQNLAPCVKECPHLLPQLEEAMTLLAFNDLNCPEAQRLIGGMEQREKTAKRIDEAILDLYRIEQGKHYRPNHLWFIVRFDQTRKYQAGPDKALDRATSERASRGSGGSGTGGNRSGAVQGALDMDVISSQPQEEPQEAGHRRQSQLALSTPDPGTVAYSSQDREHSREFGRRQKGSLAEVFPLRVTQPGHFSSHKLCSCLPSFSVSSFFEMESAVTQVGWDEASYLWEIRDFMDLREMAKEDPSCSASRLESPVFKCFSLWLFPNGQEQHESVGLIDLAIMFKGKRGSVRAKWTACFLDAKGELIPRTRLADPLKKYCPGGDGRRFSYAPSLDTLQSWLHNGTLRIYCQAFIALDCKSAHVPIPRGCHMYYAAVIAQVPPQRLKADIIHYALQADSHDVLRKMLNGPFREADAPDIHLTDICPFAAHQMLLFIHTDACELLEKLKPTCTLEEKRQRQEALMALLSAADKYDIQDECEQQLANLVDEESVLEVLLFAQSRNFNRLLEAGQKLLQGMPALRLWKTWQNRSPRLFNQTTVPHACENTGGCITWDTNDRTEALSVYAAPEVS